VLVEKFKDMMYDDVYEILGVAGIAENLDKSVWRDKENIIIETQAKIYGQNTVITLASRGSCHGG
jgi:hypothetical protein